MILVLRVIYLCDFIMSMSKSLVYFSTLYSSHSNVLYSARLNSINCLGRFHTGAVVNSVKGKGNANVKELLEDAATYDNVPKSAEDQWSTSPYPKGVHSREQGSKSLRPRVDPRLTSIIFFPGQGTQFVGMGRPLLKFPAVRDLFQEASDILKYDLLKLCTEGPEEKLNKTQYAQPAIFVCSLAALERLKEEEPSAIENCIATAGFSLGELTALTFAQVLSFEKAVQLVKIRGEAMQAASEMIPGSMAAVSFGPDSNLGLALQRAKQYATEKGVENPYCGVSNYLYPHSKIVAGNIEAIEFLEKNKADFKLRRVSRLTVSGAFHTPLMKPAMEAFSEAMKRVKLSEPEVAVYSNVDAKLYRDSKQVRWQLPRQIVAPVRWEQTMHTLYERPQGTEFPKTYECGPSGGLASILKQVNSKAWNSCKCIEA